MAKDYTPKNILITGGAGFIASHVANRLVKNYPNYKVIVLDKLDYCSNLKNLNPCFSSPNFKFIKGDIVCPDILNYILTTEVVDTIMHFAAQTHVDNSFGNSFEFTKNNTYGTHFLLEACKVIGKQQIKRFIHVSTDEVYGETNEDAVIGNHEASQLLPTNPYSASKAGAEMLVMAYASSYGLPVITTRGNNVYGPNQFPEKLIPKFILLAMRGMSFPIHGNGSNIRSYLYCEDVAEAFETILHKGEVGYVYNIGTDKERRVIDVAKDICKLFSLNSDDVIEFVENRPFNDQRYFLDHNKLKSLGWCERTSWEEGLRKTMEWYVENPTWWGDVTSALVPHPRRSMVQSSKTDASNEVTSSLKFLIYGKSEGILEKMCENHALPYEYGKGRLEDRFQILVEIRCTKPTHVLNVVVSRSEKPDMDRCELHKIETIQTNVIGTLTLAELCREHGILLINYIFEPDHAHPHPLGSDTVSEKNQAKLSGSFDSKSEAMVEELLKEYDNVCTFRVSKSMNNFDELLANSIKMEQRIQQVHEL